MTLLPILYWIILILSLLGIFAPATQYPYATRISGLSWVALFVIIGLRIFKMPL